VAQKEFGLVLDGNVEALELVLVDLSRGAVLNCDALFSADPQDRGEFVDFLGFIFLGLLDFTLLAEGLADARLPELAVHEQTLSGCVVRQEVDVVGVDHDVFVLAVQGVLDETLLNLHLRLNHTRGAVFLTFVRVRVVRLWQRMGGQEKNVAVRV